MIYSYHEIDNVNDFDLPSDVRELISTIVSASLVLGSRSVNSNRENEE